MDHHELPQFLADAALEESGAWHADPGGVSVRAWPFPYIAGLAINNDVDSMRREAFLDWHGFVNGSGATSYGDGLGLEVADSFFVYGGKNQKTLCLYRSFPDDDEMVPSPDTDLIAEYAKLGWFDTLHTLGNWRLPRPGIDPSLVELEQAERAIGLLEKLGIKLPVYVNHSGSESNIGGPWLHHYKGDNPESELFCLERLRDYGVRFFWLDPHVSTGKFGEHLAFADRYELLREIHRFGWPAVMRERHSLTEAVPVTLDEDMEWRPWLLSLFNRVLTPLPTRTGTKIMGFKRHRGIDQPYMNTFCAQVTSDDLDRLETGGGAVVIYQHFGINSLRGRTQEWAREFRTQAEVPVLDEHAVAAWRDIAERHHAGRLFIAASGRFLHWLWLRDALDYSVERGTEKWVVTIRGVDCPVFGARPLEHADLNGFALTIPEDAPDIVVHVEGMAGELTMKREAEPGHPGRDALWMPWAKLEWPEKPLM